MTTSMIINKLATKQNGAFFKIRWASELPLTAAAKKLGITAYKLTEAICRKGIDYKNQKSVQAKVDEGKILTHELPWGSWHPEHKGLVIQHKGKDYIRLYLGPNKTKTTYILNGAICTYDDLKNSGYVLNSWFNKTEAGEKPDALTLKSESIQMIF